VNIGKIYITTTNSIRAYT